jgi:MFS family permease
MMGASNVLGRMVLGPLGEKIGWMKAIAISSFACALTTLWLMAVTELWMFYVFAVAYGFFWGGRLPPLMGSVAFFFGTASLAELIGITLAGSLVVGASAPFLAGLVFDRTGSYSPVLVASFLLFAVGGVLSLLLKPPKS